MHNRIQKLIDGLMKPSAKLIAISACVALSCAQGAQGKTAARSVQAGAADSGIVETKLPDGLVVLTKEVHAAPVVCTYVWYKVGSRNETPGITGVSHQLEHMMFKGTKRAFPNPGYIDYLLGRYGGQNNAQTDTDTTSYYLFLPSDQLDLALRIEADRMTEAAIDPKQLTAEKTVVLSELEGGENDNASYLYQATQAAAFVDHPYHFPVIGTKWDVQHFSRQQVYDYYRAHYAPNNATLVIVGDFDRAKTLAHVRELWQKVAPHPIPHPQINPEPMQRGERRVIIRRAGSAPYLNVMYHIPAALNPDQSALNVLATALSGGRSSRLYRALVETQLATGVGAAPDINIDPGVFDISVSIRPGTAPEAVEKALYSELVRTQKEPLAPRELEKAKNQARANFVFAQESVNDQAARIGFYQTVTGDWRNLTRYLNRINLVTAADVQRVAGKYLGADNRTVGTFIPNGETPAPDADSGGGGKTAHYHAASDPGARPIGKERLSGSSLVLTPDGSRPPTVATRTRELANGLTVIVRENHANPTVTIAGFVRAGAVNDPVGKYGLASLTAEMLTRGAGMRSSQEIADATDFVGAQIDVSGERTRTTFSALMLKENYDLLLNLLADILQRPTFPQEELEKARGEAISALQEQENDTASVATRRLYELLYAHDPAFAHNPDGRIETVKSLDRDALFSFFRSAYRPEATTLIVVGDIDAETVFAGVDKAFGGWKAEGAPFSGYRTPARTGDDAPASPVVVTMADKSQDDVAMGLVGLSRKAPDYEAASLMNLILGGDEFVGRVGKRVRDTEGLAYYAYTSFAPAMDTGVWLFRAGVNPRNVPRALRSAREEVEKMVTAGVTAKELAWAKDHAVGSLRLSLATNGGMAAQLENSAFYGLGLDYMQRYPQIVRKLTQAQLNEAAKKYLNTHALISVVAGPPFPR